MCAHILREITQAPKDRYNMVRLMCRGSEKCLRPGGNKAVTDDHERRKRYREVCGQDG